MMPNQEKLFQSFYNRARLISESDQASWRMVGYLRNKMSDKNLDIRKRKINDMPYWCIIRWVHPHYVLGNMDTVGLSFLPVIVLKIEREDGLPREPTYRDIDNFVRIEKKHVKEYIDAFQADYDSLKKETRQIGNDYVREVKAAYPPKVHLHVAHHNREYLENQKDNNGDKSDSST